VCSFPTSISESNKDFNVILFPNPGQSNLNLSINNNLINASIVIYSSTGSLIYQALCNDKFKTINTENWNSGIYFYKLISKKGEVMSGKWTKN
jgi:hypothetical protein